MKKLPKTDSIEALAKFWDTHDVTEFERELEEVAEPVFTREKPIQVHLPAKESRAIGRIARAKRVSKEELIRRWVRQNLAAHTGNQGANSQAIR